MTLCGFARFFFFVHFESQTITIFSSSAARKVKEPHANGINNLYTRSTTRGITQVPEQISSMNIDHEMDDEDGIDNDDDDHHTNPDHDQQQPTSPTITNGSDEPNESNHMMNDDDEQQQKPPSIMTSTHQRKRMLPLTNHRRSFPVPPPPSMNGKSELWTVRAHLEKGKIKSNQSNIYVIFRLI